MPKILLDLFCGGGGAAMGYHRAGFTVIGVDNKPQPRYPFKFIQADALCYAVAFGRQFDVIHASPPCQAYSCSTPDKSKHKEMIDITRDVLQWIGKPYIIENVGGAKRHMINPLMLCGTMFGLNVIRHRYFECKPTIWFAPATCKHNRPVVKQGSAPKNGEFHSITGHFSGVEEGQKAMGIDWLGQKELSQAIPPAYTEFLGNQIMRML